MLTKKSDETDEAQVEDGHRKESRSKLPAPRPQKGRAAECDPTNGDSQEAKTIDKQFCPHKGPKTISWPLLSDRQ